MLELWKRFVNKQHKTGKRVDAFPSFSTLQFKASLLYVVLPSHGDDLLLLTARTLQAVILARGERLEMVDGRDIQDQAAAATMTAEENNEQPASDSDTSSSIDSVCNTN